MLTQRLDIEGEWLVTVCYDVKPEDLTTVAYLMGRMGASEQNTTEALENLSGFNGGVTYTPFERRESLVLIGRADSPVQFFNTVIHEVDHVQDHVCKYYGCRLGTEEAAYLQGYIGGRLFAFLIG